MLSGEVFHQKFDLLKSNLSLETCRFCCHFLQEKSSRITLTSLFQWCQNVYSDHVKTPSSFQESKNISF